MRQALHIFKKDFRYSRYEITLVALFALACAAIHLRGPHGALNESWLPEIFWFLGVAFLIGRLVLAESITGDRQFWVTRPYRWKSLLGAKLVFIFAFVNIPVLLAHLAILLIDGFPLVPSIPGLLWSQVLLFAFLLPFVALATLSAVKPFQLILMACAAGVWLLMTSANVGPLSGVGWLPGSIAFTALCATAISILYLQYKGRRTVSSRWLAAGGVLISAVVMAAMPWPLAFAVQSHLSGQNTLGASIRIGLSPIPEERFWQVQMKPKVGLHFPISVRDIPGGTEVQPDALVISLQSSDGRTTQLAPQDCGSLKRGTMSASAATISALCIADPSFFNAQHGRPVTLRASLYFTLFGNAQSETIPLSDEPANAPAGLQCYTDMVRAEWDVYCRAAFRWPARLVYAKLGRTNANSFTQFVSYSPFPANLNIDPVETRWASAYASGPPPNVRDVTIMVEEPLAHLQRNFEAQNIRLEQFAYPSVRVGPAPIDTIR
jgi:hypothetical protein